jgi:biotin-(acetyl-CoA carboxylase) ligase
LAGLSGGTARGAVAPNEHSVAVVLKLLAVRLAGRETSGCFETIDETGRLMLRHGDGALEAIAAGEVFPLAQIA